MTINQLEKKEEQRKHRGEGVNRNKAVWLE
jgi:hypothetical protein